MLGYLQCKETKQYGTKHYSSFGYSAHFFDEKEQVLGKTLGCPQEEFFTYFTELKDCPEGYEYDPSILTIRKRKE